MELQSLAATALLIEGVIVTVGFRLIFAARSTPQSLVAERFLEVLVFPACRLV